MAETSRSETEPAQRSRRVWFGRIRRTSLWMSVALLLGIALCERLQPDACAAATAIPPWCWLIACMAVGGFGWTGASRRERAVAVAIALAFLWLSVEQTHSLARSAKDGLSSGRHDDQPPRLRVISINCNIGAASAAREAAVLDPDIVLLQEAPGEEGVRELTQSMFGDAGSFVWSPDCAIIARGALQRTDNAAQHFVQATLQLTSGQTLEVISLRLSPPLVRYDLWSPSCWSEHAALRRKHRQEAADISSALSAVPKGRAIVIGGDCNAPAGDGALQVWKPRLDDAFGSAGRGWGATVLNRFPVLRFDQLWCSDELTATRVWSAPTQNSDHRLVVGDFNLLPAP